MSDFPAYLKKYLGGTIQPWQEDMANIIQKGIDSDDQSIICFHRKPFVKTITQACREYMQSICDHEWTDNVLLVTMNDVNGPRKVTACLSCQKVK